MDIKIQLKILMTLKRMKMQQLADLMTQETGKTYTPAMIYGKLNRDTLSFTECQKIAKILGHEIIFREIK